MKSHLREICDENKTVKAKEAPSELGWLSGKQSACDAGDADSISGSGVRRSARRRNGSARSRILAWEVRGQRRVAGCSPWVASWRRLAANSKRQGKLLTHVSVKCLQPTSFEASLVVQETKAGHSHAGGWSWSPCSGNSVPMQQPSFHAESEDPVQPSK